MKSRKQEITNVYKRILAIIFERLAPTFGQRTIAAIAKNVLARQAKEHGILRYLQVSEQGVDWQAFQDHLDEASEEDISGGLEDFLDEFFDALSNLIGRLIVGKLFKEAENLVKRGEEE